MQKNKIYLSLPLFTFLSILYLELIFRLTTVTSFVGIGLYYIILFSLIITLFLTTIPSVLKPLWSKMFFYITLLIITIIYLSQIIYFDIFSTYYTAFSFLNSSQVLDYYQVIMTGIINNSLPISLAFLPFLIAIVFGKKLKLFQQNSMEIIPFYIGSIICIYIIIIISLVLPKEKPTFSPYDLYYRKHNTDQNMETFGVLTGSRLDLQRFIFKFEEQLDMLSLSTDETDNKTIEPNNSNSEDEENHTISENSISKNKVPLPIIDQILPIDFDTLITNENDEKLLSMHHYFNNVTPSKTNAHTGLYEGYNLILITAEGFAPYAVDSDLTPTLYKMVNEGYQFTNFYNPIWSVSSSDGEYIATTSLIPKSGVWSMEKSGQNSMPFALGNQLRNFGYDTNAYHNHTATYYGRDVSHPNLGYDFKAIGLGLDIEKTWPESDLEMMEETVFEYVNEEPFHTYYVTVSGHMLYDFSSNYQAHKHKEAVAHLPYSEHSKAYLATQIEFDLAMESLLAQLEEAGVADNTLIAISADHYPYGLTNEEISELLGHPVEEYFELYKSTFILYTPDMEPTVVEKASSSYDILPTLSNLMGIPYDSRLLMGTDIFSDSDPLVVFSNRSFLTDEYSFNFKTKEVIPFTEREISKEEVYKTRKSIDAKFVISSQILDLDYYGLLGIESIIEDFE